MVQTEAFNYLKEWVAIYVRQRDLSTKKIAETKDTNFGFVAVKNDGSSINCIVQPK